MALERYYSLFFFPYLKPIVGTLGGYWVLSREVEKRREDGDKLFALILYAPWSKANPHIASTGTSQDSQGSQSSSLK